MLSGIFKGSASQDYRMPNLSTIFKSEITRLSKKVLKESIVPLQKSLVAQRRQINALKKQMALLEKELKRARRGAANNESMKLSESKPTGQRFQARGLRSLRAKLGLSAQDFGRLVGVSGQSIYNWESEKTLPRQNQLAGLAALRSIGKREANKRLASAK